MSETHAEFHERLARIYRKDTKLRRVRQRVAINRDGYVIVRGAGRRAHFPWMGLMMVAIAFFGIKGLLISQMGPDFMAARLAYLGGETKVEQVAAWSMRPDPISRWVSIQINSLN